MECSSCEGGMVVGKLSVDVQAPLNRKGGGLALAGIAVKQADIKAKWEETPVAERTIACNSCGAEYDYVPGRGIVSKGDGAVSSDETPEEEVMEEEEAAPPVRKVAAPPRPAPKVIPTPQARPVFKFKRPGA